MSSIFFTEKSGKYVLDIPKTGFTVNDENSEFSDDFIVNWTYPLNIFETDAIRKIFPDLSNPNAKKRKKDSGFLNIYGDVYPCDIKFLGAQQKELKIQFEFGFGVLKIFDQKLQDIDFGKIETSNLYNLIDGTMHLVYPDVGVCFPRIYTSKDLVAEIGNLYGGRNLYNDSNEGLIYRNEITPSGQVVWNLIKPIVYFLYILKRGFENEGYVLKGDIVNDDLIKYLGFNHNNIADEKVAVGTFKMEINNDSANAVNYVKEEIFSILGVYNVFAQIPNKTATNNCYVRIMVIDKDSGAVLFNYERTGRDHIGSLYYPDYSEINFTLPGYSTTKEVIYRVMVNNLNYLGIGTGTMFFAFLNPSDNNGSYYQLKNTLIFNEYLPDVTFKDIVNAAKKIGNYRIYIKNQNEIYFDKVLNSAPDNYIDLSFTEQTNPEIDSIDREKYVLTYNAPEEMGFSDYIVDNNKEFWGGVKDDYPEAEIIEFNCYPLLNKNNVVGGGTAEEPSEGMNGLGFVKYSGLKSGTNNTDSLGSYFIIDVYANRYINNLYNRLNAESMKWTFSTSSPVLSKLTSSDSIYAYGCFHKIEYVIKKYHENDVVEVEIKTENRY